MQKLLTITIDTDLLKAASKGPFTVSEIEEINTLLEAGFLLEEWRFVSKDAGNGKAILFVVLNDDSFDPYEYMDSEEEDYELDSDEETDEEPSR